MKELKLMASDETLAEVLDAIESQLIENGCSDSMRIAILIAAEEIYVNIAHYAYGGEAGEAIVQLDTTPNTFKAVFKDRGIPYNPLAKEDPDITLSIEEREIGGLGVFMVKETMDRVDYSYTDGYNVFTMEKDLK